MSVLKSFFFFLFRISSLLLARTLSIGRISLYLIWIYRISLTEIMRESVLVSIVFIHFLGEEVNSCAVRHLIGGFFLSMLIRELDAFLIFWLMEVGVVCTTFRYLRFALSRYHFRLTLTQRPYTRTPWYVHDAQWSAGSPGFLPAVWNARIMVRDINQAASRIGRECRGGRQRIVQIYAPALSHLQGTTALSVPSPPEMIRAFERITKAPVCKTRKPRLAISFASASPLLLLHHGNRGR